MLNKTEIFLWKQAHCSLSSAPIAPAYIPILPGYTMKTKLECWFCGLQGTVGMFFEFENYIFIPEIKH